jgi:hypothetical protein
MTEQEWSACEDPLRLLDYLEAPLDARKTFLLTAVCFRRHWTRLPEAGRDWVRLAELAAESGASRASLDDAFEDLEDALNDAGPPGEFVALLDLAWGMWQAEWPELHGDAAWREERQAQASLVREVFGSPFRPVALDPTALGETVPALARGIYEERAFDRLPILADALEEAGCIEADILAHCRSPGPHVSGCWAVDVVLGKE